MKTHTELRISQFSLFGMTIISTTCNYYKNISLSNPVTESYKAQYWTEERGWGLNRSICQDHYLRKTYTNNLGKQSFPQINPIQMDTTSKYPNKRHVTGLYAQSKCFKILPYAVHKNLYSISPDLKCCL